MLPNILLILFTYVEYIGLGWHVSSLSRIYSNVRGYILGVSFEQNLIFWKRFCFNLKDLGRILDFGGKRMAFDLAETSHVF